MIEQIKPPDWNIRPMTEGDLTFAAECTAAESWVSANQLTLDGFFSHEPGGCLVAELGGQKVGIVVATSYGGCGFIGELIVRSEARGQGIGGALLNRGVAYLQQRGVRTIYLDGVVKAVSL
jgi:ribosomal protein S18 acetylase RimI-like enzyme